MPIERAEKSSDNNYTVISDAMLKDESLSWKARGLLSYLLSNYDDWSVNISHLKNQAPDGRDSVRSAIDELIEAGYLKREYQRDEKGKMTGVEYTVIESGNSDIGIAENGSSDDGKSTTNQQEKEQIEEREQINKNNKQKLCTTLEDLGVNESMVDQLADQLCEKETNDDQRAKFLKSLQYDVEEKGKNGGHVVWAIRNYDQYETMTPEDEATSTVETEIDYPEANYDADRF